MARYGCKSGLPVRLGQATEDCQQLVMGKVEIAICLGASARGSQGESMGEGDEMGRVNSCAQALESLFGSGESLLWLPRVDQESSL
jgi:hypothetical protein